MGNKIVKLRVRKAGLLPLFGLSAVLVTALTFTCSFASLSFAATLQSKSFATTRIEGVVLDQNGAALSGALVAISTSRFQAEVRTDANGRFHFDSAPAAIVTLLVIAKGFSQAEQKLDPKVDDFANLRIVLSPANISESVTVTATRTETRIGQTAASVVVVSSQELQTTPALTLDDALRQVPGFSLLRRSGSRTANPTTQGVSLRGLGASGASRSLVFADGLPLNDPFGGWVYWARIPRLSVDQVEIMRGGASHLYGSSALGGVVNIATKTAETNSISFETSYGNQTSPSASLLVNGKLRDWRASMAAEVFKTDGYILVSPAERGSVDTRASSRHSVINLKLERRLGKHQRIFGSTSFFGESRGNGTPLQTNRTHIRHFSFGGELTSVNDGSFRAQGYRGSQVYDQTFSAISPDRQSENLTRLQRVPATFVGFSSQWSRPLLKRHTIVAGFEAQEVSGSSDEIVFVNGRAASLVEAGGRQQAYGGYLEALMTFGRRLFINSGARFDYWRNNNASSATTSPVTATAAVVTSFPDRAESAFSPQLSAVYRINDRVSLLASASRAFRAPTLNELYRTFRVGNVLTLANENLRSERMAGGEAGLRFTLPGGRLAARGTFFWNEITRPVANVTLTSTPGLITRQRQNLGRTRSRGLELETEALINEQWRVSVGYLLADATVVRFPVNRSAEGLLIPQVARHQFTFQASYSKPAIGTLSLHGRASSSQFDDDQNQFRLGSYFTLDALLSRRVTRGLEAFVAAENLLNQRYEVGKTPVTTLGPPILVRVGIRVHLNGR